MAPMNFRIRYYQFVHRALKLLSRTYRESSDLLYSLNCETSSHLTSKAELALALEKLATARSQIQSLTISAQRASEEAASFRDAAERAREHALEAREAAVRPMQQLADWQAQGCPRRAIFGTAPDPAPVEEPFEGPIGGIKGRAVVRRENESEYRTSLKDLQEIQTRQRARRAEAMAAVHLDETPS